MLSRDEFGRTFVMRARDTSLTTTLYNVTGWSESQLAQKIYRSVYKDYENMEVFRKVAAITTDSACRKFLDLLESGRFAHTQIEDDKNLSEDMFKRGGWIDRFSIFGRVIK